MPISFLWWGEKPQVPREVPPRAGWPTMTLADRLLLELAPHNPYHQVVGEAFRSTVKINQVREGLYSDQRSLFVLLDVQLATAEIPSFNFDVFSTATEPITDQAPPLQVPRQKAIVWSTPPPMVDSPLAQRNAAYKGTVNKSKAPGRSFWGHMSRKATELMVDISRRRSAMARTLNTHQRAPPPPNGPTVFAYGPDIVLGPPTRVKKMDKKRRWVDPKVKGEGLGVEVAGAERIKGNEFVADTAARIELEEINQGVKVRVRGAKDDAGGCPLRFRVGFVVSCPRNIDIEVHPDTTCLTDYFHWHSDPVKRTLIDTTRNGTTVNAPTCAFPGCPEGAQCKQFHEYHMTPAVWKRKLLFPLEGWDLPMNENHWVIAPGE